MLDLPSGTVTFLFTDIEGSTRLWEEHPEQMREALARHDEMLRTAIINGRGYVFATGGDGFAAAFQRASDALRAALKAQQELAASDWGGVSLQVRMALHTGESEERDGDYFGPALNKAARLMSAGHGGQVLVSQATVEIVQSEPPDSVTFQDLGEHRLRDLERPERIFQLRHPALVAEFDPLLTLESRPNNLTVQLTSFVGRENDVAEALGLLDGARLLTLTGVGGSGKTRLALQLAVEVLNDYPGGVWMVELAPVNDPELVPQTVQVVLGAKDEPGRSPVETVAALIGEKQLVLILDNCEHLVHGVADVAASLLSQCSNLKVVATSREVLHVPGEVSFVVQSLTLPPAEADRETIAGFDSVRLFTERVATIMPEFELTTSNVATVAYICRRLDGMPLALELAAARMRVMSPEQIAARLDDRFALLTGGARTALPRQQTLLATIDWSYALLDVDEQSLFRGLSVFAGGFALDTAEAIFARDGRDAYGVADLIHRLVDKSLVSTSEEPHDSIRYGLHETLREYASSELARSGQTNTVRSRHAEALVALVAEQESHMGTTDWALAIERLSVEHDNIRAGLRWSIDNSHLRHATQLGTVMRRYWNDRGLFSEGLAWIREILQLIPEADQATRGSFISFAGSLQYMLGDYASAERQFQQALTIRRNLADNEGVVKSLNALAVTADNTGDYDLMRAYLEEAIALLASDPSSEFQTQILVANLGWAAWKSGDLESARVHLQAALDETKPGVVKNVEDFLLGLAFVTWAEGDYEEAEALARRAWNLAEDQGLKLMAAGYQFAIALFAYEQGKAAVAASELLASWPIILDSEEGMWVPHWLYAAARAQLDPVSVVRIFGAVAALNERSGFMFGIPIREDVDRSLARARMALDQDDFDTAWTEGLSTTVDQAGKWALEGLEEIENQSSMDRT